MSSTFDKNRRFRRFTGDQDMLSSFTFTAILVVCVGPSSSDVPLVNKPGIVAGKLNILVPQQWSVRLNWFEHIRPFCGRLSFYVVV